MDNLAATAPSTFYRLGDHAPRTAPSAWVAPTATIIGDVEIGPESGIWFNCVLRGDANSIRIGARTNVQDNTIIHVDPGPFATFIGNDVTVGHSCLIHGCTLEDGAFVGMASTILNGAVVEGGGIVGAGALLTAGKRVKRGELWTGAPAQLRRVLSEEELREFLEVSALYARNAERFKNELAPVGRSDL
ncbi:gamma carbonic anhydrase family protein [Terrihabitans sp. B22-R8]|uniref:gamma carbonic anhydrase family protein n=1 Tax=Terrihabitans sp. B22-R8 TaxID=3425128 RepID=UPI00403D3C00